ncbi:MAG TPA: 3-hydroxyacyl-CoA dehydrogenase NAD-binding domain-containing protein [Mariprofundaceae bacterium]|nr:3-hydroxyacyl-CoA dehydrogenase NAD-binding domain-containing protein [Mariprofundaceae bacterium]
MEVVTLLREELDGRKVARLHFERSDKSVNVLDEACMQQLEAHLDALEQTPPELLLLESGMAGCFIAGADLDVIAGVTDAGDAAKLAERGQRLCSRIEKLPAVSIAMVRGACMGGGLEIALACDHIVAVQDDKTQLALPEIRIGIHPGFGGCVRLPKRVGWLTAVDMILTGRSVDAKKAKKIRLASLVCHDGQCEAVVRELLPAGKVGFRPLNPAWLRVWPASWLVFRQVKKQAYARLKHLEIDEAYPAVPATIQLLESIVGMNDAKAYAKEAASLGRLAVTPTCKNLIRVFRLGEALKKQPAVKRGREAAAAIRNASVYGAGVMGSGIAWVAAKNCEVDLHEVSEAALARGMKGLAKLAGRDPRPLARIRPTVDGSGLVHSDLVIEAVLEELAVKNALWSEVEKLVSDKALLLSNTSSLSISDMQKRRKHPGRIAGLHFFNPAPKMPLVEVIPGSRTTQQTVDTVCALAAGWGKYPVVVGDKPGFLVNRCLMPYMVAALKLIENGQKPGHVDGALKCFGMPMGAIELADRVGLDICEHVGAHLGESFGERFAMPEWFGRMVKDGLLGAKSGAGFFLYEKNKGAEEQGRLNPALGNYLATAVAGEHEGDADIGASTAAPMADAAIVDACLLPMLVESLACLHDKLVDDPVHIDAAFVYGIGFPPFRGGLLRYFAGRKKGELRQKISDLGLPIPENLDVLDAFA